MQHENDLSEKWLHRGLSFVLLLVSVAFGLSIGPALSGPGPSFEKPAPPSVVLSKDEMMIYRLGQIDREMRILQEERDEIILKLKSVHDAESRTTDTLTKAGAR